MKLFATDHTASVTMVLKKGVLLPIRINDPGGIMAQAASARSGAHILLGVPTDAGPFLPAYVTSRDSKGTNYQVLIPYGAPVKLVLRSPAFLFGDAVGTPLGRAAIHIPINLQPGATPAGLVFKVLGVN